MAGLALSPSASTSPVLHWLHPSPGGQQPWGASGLQEALGEKGWALFELLWLIS